MKMNKVIGAISFFLLSCSNKQSVKAHIYERKELPKNRLLIRYEFFVNGVLYKDSATVTNRVLPNDSIILIVNSDNPQETLPDLGSGL